MGAPDSFVYLASPAVVAASAIAGKITSSIEEPPASAGAVVSTPDTVKPRGLKSAALLSHVETLRFSASCRTNPRPLVASKPVEIIAGFPQKLEGELLFIPKDNLNTDGIYGKEYTYKELPPAEMAQAAMANYDPEFQKLAQEGDLLVGGYNFGSGSSREQAATALKHRGLQMIVAGSFSQTYKRNAFNNGYVCIECSELVEDLKKSFKDNPNPTIRTTWHATVNFASSQINVAAGLRAGRSESKTYTFSPLGQVAQELIVKGGFEAVIRDQLAKSD